MACLYLHKGTYYTANQLLEKFNSPVERINFARTWLETNTNLKPEDLSIVNGLIENASLGRMMEDGKIVLSSLAPESVYYHEGFHRIYNFFATDAQRVKLINEFKASKNAKALLETMSKIYNSKEAVERRGRELTEEELIEENLAEEFHEFMMSGGKAFIESQAKKSLFQRILDYLLGIKDLSNRLKDREYAQDFYQAIMDGSFSKSPQLIEKIDGYRDSISDLTIKRFTPEQSIDLLYTVHANFIDEVLEQNKFYDIVDGRFEEDAEDAKDSVYNKIFNTAIGKTISQIDSLSIKTNVSTAVKELKQKHKLLLQEYKMLQDDQVESYIDSLYSEEKSKDNEFNKNSVEFDPKLSIKKSMRFLLTSIPSNKKNSIGTNTIVPVKEVNAALLTNLSNIPPNFEEFSYVLNNLSEKVPHIQKVFNILNSEYEKGNERFVTDFINSFNNAYVNFDLIIDNNNKLQLISANQKAFKDQLLGEWKQNLDYNINTNPDIIDTLANFNLRGASSALNFFKLLGVDIKKSYIGILKEAKKIQELIKPINEDRTVNPNYEKLKNNPNLLSNIFDVKDKMFLYAGESNNMSYIFSSIAEMERKNRNDLDIMIFNAENKPVYPISQYNYLTMTVNWLNYYRTKYEEDVQAQKDFPDAASYLSAKLPFLFNYSSDSSYWLKDIIRNSGRLSFNLMSGIQLSNDTKIDFRNVSDFDYYISSMKLFSQGKVMSFTQGDRQLFPVFGAPSLLDISNAGTVYRGYIKSEVLRLHNLSNRALNFDKIKGLNKQEGNQTIDPTIFNVQKFYNSIAESLKDKPINEVADIIESELNARSNEIQKNLQDFIDKKTNHYIKTFKDLKISDNKSGKIKDVYISEADKNGLSTEEFIEKWFINTYFGNIEQSKLLYGDIALFSKYDDFWKRMNTPTSTGTPSVTSQEFLDELDKDDGRKLYTIGDFNYSQARAQNGATSSTIKEQFLADKEVKSTDLEKIREKAENKYRKLYTTIFPWEDRFKSIFGDKVTPNLEQLIKHDADKHVKAFSKITETDGFSYINLFEWRRVMKTWSLWTTQHDNLFNTEIEVLKIAMDDTLSDKEKEEKFNNIFNVGARNVDDYFSEFEQGSLLKPQYAGPVYNMSPEQYDNLNDLERANVYGIRKTSFMPLLPSVIFGTNLETLHHKMLRSGTGITFYESAAKVGISTTLHNVDDVVTAKDNQFETLNGKFSTYIDFKYLKNQVLIDSEEKQKIIDATQSRKNMIADKYHEQVPLDYILENSDKTFDDIKKTWDALSEEEKLSASDFHKNVEDYIKFTGRIIEKKREDLLNEFKIAVTNPDLTEFDIENINSLINVLKSNAISRGNTIDLIDSFTYMIQNGTTLFNVFPNSTKLQSLITSIVTNNAIKIKRNGSDYAQVSPTLWEKKGKLRSISDESNPQVLKTYGLDDLSPSEIIIPAPKEILKKIEKAIDKGENEEIMKAYNKVRKNYLPGFNIKVLVDTLNELIRTGYLDSEVTLKGLRIPNQELSSNDVFKIKKFAIPTMSKFVVVNSELISKTGSDFDIDKLNLYFKNLDKNLKEIAYSEDNQSEEALFNKLSEIEQKLILNEVNLDNLMHPVEDAGLRDLLVTRIEKLQEYDERYSVRKEKNLYEAFLPENNLQKKNDLSQANIGIGQFATHGTGHSIARNTILSPTFKTGEFTKEPVVMSTRLMFKGFEDNNNFGKYFSNDLESIPQLISGLLTTQMDAAKDPYAVYLNIKTYVIPVICYLLRRGVNKEVVFSFLTQPAILQFINRRDIFSSSLYRFGNKDKKVKTNKKVLTDLTNLIGSNVELKDVLDVSKIDPKDLLDSDKYKDKDFQKNVLLYFLSLKEQATLFNDYKKLMSSDTTFHKSLNSYKEQLSMYDDVKASGIITNLDEMLTTGFIAPFTESAKLYYYPWKSLFLSGRDFGSHISVYMDAYSNGIANSLALKSQEGRLKLKESMERQFFTYLLDNYKIGNIEKSNVIDIFSDVADNVKDVLDFKKLFSKILDYGTIKKENILQGKVKTFTPFEINNYLGLMNRIYLMPAIKTGRLNKETEVEETITGKEFITQLYLQSLKQSKNDFSAFDISSILPGYVKTEILTNVLNQFLQLEKDGVKMETLMADYVKQFQLNNPKYISKTKSAGLLYKTFDKGNIQIFDEYGQQYAQKGFAYTSNFDKSNNPTIQRQFDESEEMGDYNDLEFFNYAYGDEEGSYVRDYLGPQLAIANVKIKAMESVKVVNGRIKDLYYSDNASKDTVNGQKSFIRKDKLIFGDNGVLSLREQEIEKGEFTDDIPETKIGTYTIEDGNYNIQLSQEALDKIIGKTVTPSLYENKPEGLPSINRTPKTC